MWKKNAHIVIVEYVYHKKNDIKSKSFRFAKIEEVGKDDLLVSPKRSWGIGRLMMVPKSSCVLIDEEGLQPQASPREPAIGDLVCAFVQKFSGNTEYNVGHIYEKKYSPGNPVEYLVKTSDKEDWYSSDRILVLEGEKNVQSPERNK